MTEAPACTRRTVLAAGALVWRPCPGGEDGIEVLLVHRPRYDDWSFPKGKLEEGECLVACAVREVQEETGVAVRLEQPLETVRYPLADGRRKKVRYWAARPVRGDDPCLAAREPVESASAREIDAVAWVEVGLARERLTHDVDRQVLGQLRDLWEDGRLDTWTFVLVRHARAVKRSVWNRPGKRSAQEDEASRPLTRDQGEQRAAALVPVLAAYGVRTAVTSPWRRCVDTLAPYAREAGLRLREEPAVTEHAHAARPKDTRRLVERALRVPDAPLALCTHRPVLPTVMEVVARHAPGRLLRAVPDRDPWLRTGEVMVIHMARRPRGRIRAVAIEKHRPSLSAGR
ncbi:NUDIX domain-containing protein [Actinomyces sp. W5033]|uniref:NUDIX domain-containing protein n=1 Tax=Actinomyces sp. W5033 TaxID=3446479 RepID=UPI003EE288CB